MDRRRCVNPYAVLCESALELVNKMNDLRRSSGQSDDLRTWLEDCFLLSCCLSRGIGEVLRSGHGGCRTLFSPRGQEHGTYTHNAGESNRAE